MDCEKITTVSRFAGELEGNIADRTRYKTFKKLKSESDSKNVDGGTRFSNQHINKLPDDILCHIFSYLNIKDRLLIERVCPRWREIGFNSWSDICELNQTMLSLIQKRLKLSKLIEVLERCNLSLRKLEINFFHLWIKRFPEEICSYCPNLKSLIICGNFDTLITENAMVMVKGWKNLTEINFSHLGISDDCLYWFFSACNIEHIDLSGNTFFGNNFYLLKDCLKSLNLNGCCRLSSDNLIHVANLHGIRILNLTRCVLINVSTIISVVKSSQESLVELYLGRDFLKSDDGQTFSMVARYCRNIQILDFTDNYDIDDDVVAVISNTCLQLRVLNLWSTRVTDDSLRSLCILPQLQHLCVSKNKISKDGIRYISESQSLKKIELVDCWLIVNQDIIYLVKNCRTLKVVDVAFCSHIEENLTEELLSQLPREEGYTLDVIGIEDYQVTSRFVYENSEMVLHEFKVKQ